MPRVSPRSITLKINLRCEKVYPGKNTNRNVNNLKTIGIKLSRDQAIRLGTVLCATAQEWNEIDITAYRLKERTSDGTYPITITSNPR